MEKKKSIYRLNSEEDQKRLEELLNTPESDLRKMDSKCAEDIISQLQKEPPTPKTQKMPEQLNELKDAEGRSG